jgi:hypothetical protein
VIVTLTEDERFALHDELRDRFEDARARWVEVANSPHYPVIISASRRGAWSLVSQLLQEIWEGTDR